MGLLVRGVFPASLVAIGFVFAADPEGVGCSACGVLGDGPALGVLSRGMNVMILLSVEPRPLGTCPSATLPAGEEASAVLPSDGASGAHMPRTLAAGVDGRSSASLSTSSLATRRTDWADWSEG